MAELQEIQAMLNEIRSVMARCKASEKSVYNALLDEAEGWKMRMEELEVEEEDT